MVRTLYPVLAACAVMVTACSTASQPSATAGTSSPVAVQTVLATPSSAPTPTPTPAPTLEPTPTPELLPSTFRPGGTAPAEALEIQLGSCCALIFEPWDLTTTAGQVELFLTSFPNDQFPFDHDMQIGLELGQPLVASPVLNVGEKGLWVIEDLPAADYVFWCSVAGHYASGMVGTLTVTP